MPEPVAVIIGAGDATGGAIARRFAREGYTVCVTRRNEEALTPLVQEIEQAGGKARPFGCDARDEEQMVALFDTIENEVGPVEVVVFNIGANVFFSIRETTARVYRKVWEMAAFAGFLAGREAARVMVPRNKGTIIFTGATASLRGGKGFSAFASAKFPLRGLMQWLARTYQSAGIHVAHVILDRIIDISWSRVLHRPNPSRMMKPEGSVGAYWHLARQPKSMRAHEIDLLPSSESL